MSIKKTRIISLALALTLIFAMAVPVVANAVTGSIVGNNVMLRSGAGTSYPAYGQVHNGDTFNLLGTVTVSQYKWRNVDMTSGQNASNDDGWVRGDYTSLGA